MKLIGEVGTQVVQPVVAAGIARLREREKWPPQQKVGERGPRDGTCAITERKEALAEIFHKIEELQATHVRAELEGVAALHPRQAIGELEGVVLADLGLKDVAVAEVGITWDV